MSPLSPRLSPARLRLSPAWPRLSLRPSPALLRLLRSALPVVLALALIVAVLAAAAGATLLLVSRSSDGVRTALEDNRRSAALSAATGMRGWFTTARGQAGALAAALPDPAQDTSRLRSRMLALAPAATAFDAGVLLVAPDGLILAAGPEQQVHVGRYTTVPLPRVLAGQPAVTSVVENREQRRPVVMTQAPVMADGRVVAAVVGASSLTGLTEILSGVARLPGLSVSLVAVDDVVLTPGSDRPDRLVAGAGFPAADARGEAVLARYPGEGGVPTLAGIAPVSDGWTVLVAGDAQAVDRLVRLPLAAALPGVVVLALLGLAGIVVVDARARHATRQIRESRRAMLAVVGHELRTPLTVILGYGQMLTTRWDKLPEPRRQEYVATIARQSRTLDRLIERLLHAGQLGRGTAKTLALKNVPLADPVRQSAALFAAESPLHTFAVEVEEGVAVRADAAALTRIVGHLLENAVKYSPAGGEVAVTAFRSGQRVRLVVEDEGIGLPADTSKMFDDFTQGQDVDTRVQDEGGVGLGLHIVRTLTEAMGGTVRAERRRPSGARFVVLLPAAEVAAAVPPQPGRPGGRPLANGAVGKPPQMTS